MRVCIEELGGVTHEPTTTTSYRSLTSSGDGAAGEIRGRGVMWGGFTRESRRPLASSTNTGILCFFDMKKKRELISTCGGRSGFF